MRMSHSGAVKRNGVQIDLGQRMSYWREKAGLSHVDIAQALGVDASAVSHWEANRNAPRLENLEAYATACGIDLRMFWSPINAEKATG